MTDGAPDPDAVGIPLSVAMDRFLRHLKSAPVDTLTGLRSSWNEIVGPQLAPVSRPVSLTEEILLISCDDPSWASQLRWMEAPICQAVRDRFDVPVQSIRVRLRHR